MEGFIRGSVAKLAAALFIGVLVGGLVGFIAGSYYAYEAAPRAGGAAEAEAPSAAEGEKVVRVQMRVFQWGFDPAVIEVEEGTRVIIEIVEVTSDKDPNFPLHTFTLTEFGVHQVLEVGKTYTIEFVADKPGTYTYECAIFCGVGHADMKGKLIVRPKGEEREVAEIDYTDLEQVKSTLKVLVDESQLPDEPQKWSLEDYMYLMIVVQREYEGGALKVINTRTLEDLGDIVGVGSRVHVVEPNPADKRWVYSISRDGWVSKIDLYTLQVVRQIRVGTDSRGLAVSEDGRYLAVGNYSPNTLAILDAYTLEPLKIIKVYGVDPDGEPVESRVAGLAYARGYFVFSAKELGEVWVVEAKPPFRVVATLEAARVLHELVPLTEDERYVAAVSQKDNVFVIIDLEELKVVGRVPAPQIPHPGPATHDFLHGLWYSNSAKEAKLTVIDLETLELVGYVWPEGIDVEAGGGLFSTPIPPGAPNVKYIVYDIVFGPHQGTLVLVDRELVARGVVGPDAVAGIITWEDLGLDSPGRVIHPEYTYDGRYLVVSAWDHNKVIILDAAALPEVKIVKVIEAVTPTGIFPLWRVEAPWLG